MYATKVICVRPRLLGILFLGEDGYVLHSSSKWLTKKSWKKSQSNRLKTYLKEHLDSLQIQGKLVSTNFNPLLNY